MKQEEAQPGDIVKFNKEGEERWANYRGRLFQIVSVSVEYVNIVPLVPEPLYQMGISWAKEPGGGGFFADELEKVNI